MLRFLAAGFFALTVSLVMSSQSLPGEAVSMEATPGQHSEAIEYLLSAAASVGDAQEVTLSRQSDEALSGPDVVSKKCCKVCRKGKACGDSCIAKWKQCHKGKGCACDG